MTSLLSLTDVGKSFWRGTVRVEVLRRVSLELAPGDFVAVWGSLGSGKSTLLRIAAGLDRPDQGEVRVDGRPISELPRRDLQHLRRQEVGFADRSGPFERELTALDHVAFPLMGTMRRAEASRRAMEALRQLGLEPACGTLRWRELTDGERTLVSIAHAIVRRPKLLLVDDPTSNLGLHERERDGRAAAPPCVGSENGRADDGARLGGDARRARGLHAQRWRAAARRAVARRRPDPTAGRLVRVQPGAPLPRAVAATLRAGAVGRHRDCGRRRAALLPQVASTSLTGSVEQLTAGIVGQTSFQLSARGPQGFDEALLAEVQSVEGVKDAAPVLEAPTVIGPEGGARWTSRRRSALRRARGAAPAAFHIRAVGSPARDSPS